MEYKEFLECKTHTKNECGFEPIFMPDKLFPFQRSLVDWATRKGRSAIFADCLSAGTVIDSPDGDISIQDACWAKESLRVYSLLNGHVVIAQAGIPFVNGVDALYEFRFASGRTITATKGHRFLTPSGWKRGDSLQIGECLAVSDVSRLRSISESFLSIHGADDQHYEKTTQDCQSSCLPCYRRCDEQPHTEIGIGASAVPLQDDAREHIPMKSQTDAMDCESTHIRHRQSDARRATGRCDHQAETIVEGEEFQTPSFSPSCNHENIRTSEQVHEGTILVKPTRESHPSAIQQNGGDLCEPYQNSFIVWDTLSAIDYITHDVFYDIEVPGPANFLAAGVWSHNCGLGKTPMQLTWAENVARKTDGRVLILTPLAVAPQTVQEGEKFGIEVKHRREGIENGDRIVVTNYERLHYFKPEDFHGVVCDESSILKNFDGATRTAITDFMRKRPYRLLCTATAAPNDYIELGTSSEALGEIGCTDMISKFFKKIEKTMSRKDEHRFGIYRFRGHSETFFWRWVCSWARALRKPSDMGFDDSGFSLPPLSIVDHIIDARTAPSDMLFPVTAVNLQEQRDELKRTIPERCEIAAHLVNSNNGPSLSWCYLNEEGKTLRHMIPGSIEICGSDSDERKESVFLDFSAGNIKSLITKPKIGGFGMNWQRCAHQTIFPSHSYEQFYQCIRRSWRFGQEHPVTVDVIITDSQSKVLENIKRKTAASAEMFDQLVALMRDELHITNERKAINKEVIPSWL